MPEGRCSKPACGPVVRESYDLRTSRWCYGSKGLSCPAQNSACMLPISLIHTPIRVLTAVLQNLQDLGFPWVMRKVMLKYGSQSTDIIRQTGNSLRITSVNAKGSWAREMVEGREIGQVRPVLPLGHHRCIAVRFSTGTVV